MIPLCPVCGYSLQGLPEDHQCPKCGLRYDAESEIYFHVNPRVLWGAMVGSVGGLSGVTVTIRSCDLGDPFSLARSMLFVFVVGSILGWVALRIRRMIEKRGVIIAVLPDGLFVRIDRDTSEWIRWENITRASALPKLRVASLFIKDARVVRSVSGVFKTHDDARRFVDQVNERVSGTSGPVAGGGAESN